MNKLFQIAILMYLSMCSTYAQSVNQEMISRAVDKLNCLATENSVIESKKEWNCNCDNNPSYDIIKKAIPTELSNTLALSEEINKIKNQNISIASEEYLVDYLSEDVFNKQTQYSKLFSFATSRRTNKSFKDWKRKLKSEISAIVISSISDNKQFTTETVQQKSETNAADIENPLNTSDEASVQPENETKSKKSFFTFEIDVFAIALIFLMGFIIYKLGRINSHSSSKGISQDSKSIKKNIEEYINPLKTSSSRFSSDIGQMQFDVRQMKQDIEYLKQKIKIDNNTVETNQPKTDDVNSIKSASVIESNSTTEIIFLSTPNNEGSFNDSSSLSFYKEGASIYKLIKSSSNVATFQIDDRESSVKMAMQFPEKNILPVCDSENEYEPKYNKVKTIELGKVSLEGGKWNVKRKAKIRYES